MQSSEGRVPWAKKAASSKALRWYVTAHVSETEQVRTEVTGEGAGGERGHTYFAMTYI